MKKILIAILLLFGFMIVACDIDDTYVLEEWTVYEYVADGVVLESGGLFNTEYLETDDITSDDVEIGDSVFLRIYESGNIEVVMKYVESTTEIGTTS